MTTDAYLYHPGQSELRWFGETYTYFLATRDQTDGEFALVDEQAKRGERVPLHRHEDDRESFYVLEGEVTYFSATSRESAPARVRSCTCPPALSTASGSSLRQPAT